MNKKIEKIKGRIVFIGGLEGEGMTSVEAKVNEVIEALNKLIEDHELIAKLSPENPEEEKVLPLEVTNKARSSSGPEGKI